MNTKTKTGSFLLGLSLALAYILGCATSRMAEPSNANAQYAAPPPPAGAAVQRWSYQCTDGYNAETINERANTLGQQGWEMVAGLGSTRVQGLWCFKRPM